MKSGKARLQSILLLVMLAMLVGACAPTGSQAAPEAVANTITVSGVGRASGDPDMATLTVGVTVSDPIISNAVAQSNDKIDAITNALSGLGVGADDIQTQSFNIWQEDRYDPATGEPLPDKRYHVDSTVQVIVRDINSVSQVLEAAIANGANNIYGLSFDIADKDSLAALARAAALADAQGRAEQIAGEIGVGLGDVTQVSDQTGGPIYTTFEARGLGGGGGGAPPVSEGALTVTVTISVSYAIGR